MLSYIKGLLKPPPPPVVPDPKPTPAMRVLSSPTLDEAYCLIVNPKLVANVGAQYDQFTNDMILKLVGLIYSNGLKEEFKGLREFNFLLHEHPTETPDVLLKGNLLIHKCPYYETITNNLWIMNHCIDDTDTVKSMVLLIDSDLLGMSPVVNTGNNILSTPTNSLIQTWSLTFNLKITTIKILNNGNTVVVTGVNNEPTQIGLVLEDFKKQHDSFYAELRSLR